MLVTMTNFKSCVFVAIILFQFTFQAHGNGSFAKINGLRFEMNNKPLYLNGFNAYWLMYMSADPSTRDKTTSAFQQASKYGMNVVRTWAFSDGGNDRPLQISPGVYNEQMFKGLDFVISEAKKYGIQVIPCLVNNYKDYGGRTQYVQWARERGQRVNKDDDFFSNPVIKGYYRNHVKKVLTRINSITGVAYKDDPTIFAWELINEPRSDDSSGALIQEWVKEMASYVKSIDSSHMLDIGLEGFYGDSKKMFNPRNYVLGTDFIANNLIPEIDFATIHLYPEVWLQGSSEEEQTNFVRTWIQVHTRDSNSVIRKPLAIAEFGKSSKLPGYSLQKRDGYFRYMYDAIYTSAKSGGSFTGSLFWQLTSSGMDNMGDGYQVVLDESPTTAAVIAEQSQKLSSLTQKEQQIH